MDCFRTRLIISVLLLLFFQWAKGAVVSGKVTDETNEGLPFVSVYLQGTTFGVTTNKDGNYSIELPAGSHDLVFQLISYKKHGELVHVESNDQKIILNVKMEPQPYEIAEVTVNGNAEDPAYEVMRKAIRMRKYYLNQVEFYNCDVYIKGLQRVTSYPKKFMGFDVNAEGEIDKKTGIFYLSESVSKFYFKQPDKIHEVMVSSKVSGNSKAFSYNQTSDLLLNFYNNIVDVRVVSKRGFVSPIAEGAMFYYNYHLAGTFYENGKAINKIQVLPKRKNDPAFRGYIYITENTWRIHSTDLYLIKDAGIEVIDTLRINQVHLPVAVSPLSSGRGDGGEVWMLFSNKLTFSFSIFSFKGNGMYLGIHSRYNVRQSGNEPPKGVIAETALAKAEEKKETSAPPPASKRKKRRRSKMGDTNIPFYQDIIAAERDSQRAERKMFSSGEIMKVNKEANKKDSSYWASVRPVPLTEEEKLDYKQKDSIQVIHESKTFLDSVDKKTNKFKPIDLLFGYSHESRYKKRTTSFSPLLENVQYNTVQGWVAATELEIDKKFESEKHLYKTIGASYGFSDKRINARGKILYEINHRDFTNMGIEGGRQTVQFNEKKPISPLVNSVYSLFDENNYMKLFQKDYLRLSYNSELANGVYLRTFLEYSDRAALMNTTNYVMFSSMKNHGEYTSNDPLLPLNDSLPSFKRNQALELRINLRLRFRQKYVTRPDEKWVYGSKYPSLHLEYRKSLPGILGSDMNYDLVKLSITDKIKLGLLGKANYLVSAGKFLNSRKMELMDYYHFSGNKTIFSNFDFTDFQLLDYYTYSTNGSFLEAHYEHDFGGFILNKFPLLRKLKVNELAGLHYLHTEKLPNYFEVFVGIEKLNLLRVDFVSSFTDKAHLMTGIRLGLKVGGR